MIMYLIKINTGFLLFILIIFIAFNHVKLSADQAIKIYADEINIDENDEEVSAFGQAIAINENKVKIKSDKLNYQTKQKKINAEGNVIINDELGNTYFLNNLTSSSDLEKIEGKKVKVRLNDGSRIVGSSFVKDGELSVINDAEFTPCNEKNYLIKNCPGWKLKSKNIYRDSTSKTIHYDHARIHLFNVPVFYLPYFSHPDPSVKKRTGLLMPTIQTDNQLGDTFSIPIFINFRSNQDLTFTPNIQSKSNNFYSINYRHLNEDMMLEVDASIDDNDDNSGTSNHLFFQSKIFNSFGDLDAYLKTSNNDTYMRKNKINNLTILKSGIDFKRELGDEFFLFQAIGYKHLTAQEEQREYLYPNVIYDINNIDNNIYEGNMSLNNKLSFRKKLDKSYISLVSSQLNWSNQKINKNFGIVSNNQANVRIVSISIDEKTKKDSNNIRFYPQISSKLSYPLLKNSYSYSQSLTPIVMPIISPYNNYTNVKGVTNSNIFSANRATSITEWEGGPRVNYGFEWYVNASKGPDVKTVIGQTYRFNKRETDINKEISDYFIGSNLTFNAKNYLDASLIVNRDDLELKSLNANSFNDFKDLILAVNYDYTSGKYGLSAEQIAIGGKYNLEKDFYLKFTGTRNLSADKNIGYQYGILYENDCLGIDFNYYRDLTKDRDIEESDGFSFTIVLKPFGSSNKYGENKVFGPRI